MAPYDHHTVLHQLYYSSLPTLYLLLLSKFCSAFNVCRLFTSRCDAISDEWWQDGDGDEGSLVYSFISCGLVWFGLVWFGLVWFGTHKGDAMLWASNWWTEHICSKFKQCYLCPSMNTHLQYDPNGKLLLWRVVLIANIGVSEILRFVISRAIKP